jgi:hypothetical protein
MADDLARTLIELRASAAAFDNDGVEAGIERLEWFTDDDGTWGGELFEAVKSLLADGGFLNTGTSYRLVSMVRLEWDWLSAHQREELRPLMASAFDKFGDWLGAQLTAEIFAERYADAAAFATLEALSRDAANGPARALAAYGIGRLARTLEGPLRDRAMDVLNALMKSSEPDVVAEACGALAWFNRTQ